MEVMSQGAEAIIYKDGDVIVKFRVPKKYRIKDLDERLRKSRTKREAKILRDLSEMNVPKLMGVEKYTLKMEFVCGKKLKDVLILDMCTTVGEMVGKMHARGIIHGDLTTSNMILHDGEIYFIDFGLGKYTKKVEDFAVDILVFKQCLKATHTKMFKACWKNFLDGYLKFMDTNILRRVEKVEKRRRYS